MLGGGGSNISGGGEFVGWYQSGRKKEDEQVKGVLAITGARTRNASRKTNVMRCDGGMVCDDAGRSHEQQPSLLVERGHLPKMSGNEREATGSHARPFVSQPDL